jgi:hypothetical protein
VFFTLSKVLGFFALPTNFLISLGLLGIILLFTRFTRMASWLIVTSVVLLAIAGLSPLGNVLILPLEQRFPPWDPSRGPPDGIVMLGGVILPQVSLERGTIALAVCGKTWKLKFFSLLRVIASGVLDRSRRFWWSEQPPAYAAISLGMRIRL